MVCSFGVIIGLCWFGVVVVMLVLIVVIGMFVVVILWVDYRVGLGVVDIVVIWFIVF